jgi:hypothetical protein
LNSFIRFRLVHCSFWLWSSPYSSKYFDSKFPFAYGYLKSMI